MERFTSIVEAVNETVDRKLSLPFEKRQKSRQRANTLSGETVFIELPRGTIMRDGQVLTTDHGQLLKIEASLEQVSSVTTNATEMLARVAYHLGNRHVALQIGDNWVRYQQDPVLDIMVTGLGLEVVAGCHRFEPEAGAYSQVGHSHH